jgi:phage terminase large subunit-like protein
VRGRRDGRGPEYWLGGEDFVEDKALSPDLKITTKNGDTLYGKTQEQALLQFESSEVDIVWFDEIPTDESIFNSCLLRLRVTHGIIILTYTPLMGLDWTFQRFWKLLVKQGRAIKDSDRAWYHAPEKGRGVVVVQTGTRDNPVARDYADEIEADPEMSDAEKAARLYGIYGFAEGALLPRLSGLDLESPSGWQKYYVLDNLPGATIHEGGSRRRLPGGIAEWSLWADPNKSFGTVLWARDYDDNMIAVDYHLEEGWADLQHVEALREILAELGLNEAHVAKYADYGGAGAHSIVNLAFHGMAFNNVEKGPGSVSRSIKRLRGRTFFDPNHSHPLLGPLTEEEHGIVGAPRIYFYRPRLLKELADALTGRVSMRCELLSQLSQARQTDDVKKPPDTPHKDVKDKLDLFDCSRYPADHFASAPPPDEGQVMRKQESHEWRKHHIPTDEALTESPSEPGPWDRDFYVPDLDLPF